MIGSCDNKVIVIIYFTSTDINDFGKEVRVHK